MKFIILDSCTARHQVALACDGSIVGSLSAPRGSLPAMTQKLLQHHSWSLSELSAIAVTVGPGSYTGIRVGAASAQGLALAHGLPILELCSLRSMLPKQSGPFAVILDARRDHVYAQLAELKAEALEPALPESGLPVWHGEPSYRSRASLPADLPLIEAEPDLRVLAAEAKRLYQAGHGSTQPSLKLLYLRKTQAELEREPQKT